MSEYLSRLRRDQLQKFAQYLISELPQQVSLISLSMGCERGREGVGEGKLFGITRRVVLNLHCNCLCQMFSSFKISTLML